MLVEDFSIFQERSVQSLCNSIGCRSQGVGSRGETAGLTSVRKDQGLLHDRYSSLFHQWHQWCLWEDIFKKAKYYLAVCERKHEEIKCEKQPWRHLGQWRRRGRSCSSRAKIFLQLMESLRWSRSSPCKPWRTMLKQISTVQSMEDPMIQQKDILCRKIQPLECPNWSRFLAEAYCPWKRARPGGGGEYEKEGMAKENCYELTVTPFPSCCPGLDEAKEQRMESG